MKLSVARELTFEAKTSPKSYTWPICSKLCSATHTGTRSAAQTVTRYQSAYSDSASRSQVNNLCHTRKWSISSSNSTWRNTVLLSRVFCRPSVCLQILCNTYFIIRYWRRGPHCALLYEWTGTSTLYVGDYVLLLRGAYISAGNQFGDCARIEKSRGHRTHHQGHLYSYFSATCHTIAGVPGPPACLLGNKLSRWHNASQQHSTQLLACSIGR